MSGDEDGPTLERLWKGGRTGCLCPFQQMKAVVYRDVLKDTGSLVGMQTVIAKKLTKIGGGSVSIQAVSLLFARVETR